MTITLATLRNLFPVQPSTTRYNTHWTGRIDINYFNQNETEIRQIAKAIGARIYYRGPRLTRAYSGEPASTTLRRNATGAVLVAS